MEIDLQGGSTGHIFGDIQISDWDVINVTNGTTYFDGVINNPYWLGNPNAPWMDPYRGQLNIYDGGKLVLCQEGWQGACDPNGWGNANYNPANGVNGPSMSTSTSSIWARAARSPIS